MNKLNLNSVEGLYNQHLKLAYIEDYFGEVSTKQSLVYEFAKSAPIEKQKEKDLFAFFEDDIVDLLYSLQSGNINSLEKSVSIFKDYINWCIVNGKRGEYENGENRMDIFQKVSDTKKYISNRKIAKIILTKEELENIVDSLVNVVDKAYVIALYELINGEGLHELRHLSIQAVEEALQTGQLKLLDANGDVRYQCTEKKILELFKEAYYERTYLSNNGFPDKRGEISERDLSDSKFIFRLLKRKDTKYQPISYSAAHSKMQSIKRYTGYDFLSPGSLRDTRVVHEIADAMKKLDLKYPCDLAYDKGFERIENKYNIYLSYQQKRGIITKFEQAFTIKNY